MAFTDSDRSAIEVGVVVGLSSAATLGLIGAVIGLGEEAWEQVHR